MSFNIDLYKNIAEFNRVDKTDYLEKVGTLTGVLREGTSIIEPIITIEYPKMVDFNYCYIEEFGGRWYFIDDVISERNNVYVLVMSVDVLMTYIRNYEGSAYVKRCEDYNYEYSEVKIDTTQIDEKLSIGSGFEVTEIEIDNDVFEDTTTEPTESDLRYVLTGFKLELEV